MTEAPLARFIDRDTIEYVRTYPHPIDRVWSAITDTYVNVHNWPADPPEHPAGKTNPWRPVTLSGWRRSFDHLGVLMDGGAWVRPSQAERDALDQRYREHMLATQP